MHIATFEESTPDNQSTESSVLSPSAEDTSATIAFFRGGNNGSSKKDKTKSNPFLSNDVEFGEFDKKKTLLETESLHQNLNMYRDSSPALDPASPKPSALNPKTCKTSKTSSTSDPFENKKNIKRDGWTRWPVIRIVFDVCDWLWTIGHVFGFSLVAVILLVYGMNQGFAEALQDISTNYYWKDVQKLEPDATQVYTALSSIPWDLKPIYGLITDAFPIFGYRRWPYLAMMAILGMISWWALVVLPPGAPLVATLFMGGVALSTAFPDVVIDAVVAEKTRAHPMYAGDLQSLSWGSMAAGGLLGYIISGPTAETVGTKGSFGILSLTFLAVLGAAWLLPEERIPLNLRNSKLVNLLKSCRLFLKTIRNRAIWRPALFIYLAHGGLCPDISQAIFFWYTDPIQGPGFKERFIGFVYAMGYIGSLVGVAVYNRFFKQAPYRNILAWAQVLMCFAGLLDLTLVTRTNQILGIPDKLFGIGDRAASNAVARLQLMPMLVLAAHLCPPGIEGTLFAFLMSVSNFGRHTAEWEGAFLLRYVGVSREDYSRLWVAVLVRTVMRLLPIFFIFLVPEGNSDTSIAPRLGSEREREGLGEVEEGEGLLGEEMGTDNMEKFSEKGEMGRG